jgi:hypothetical protein
MDACQHSLELWVVQGVDKQQKGRRLEKQTFGQCNFLNQRLVAGADSNLGCCQHMHDAAC